MAFSLALVFLAHANTGTKATLNLPSHSTDRDLLEALNELSPVTKQLSFNLGDDSEVTDDGLVKALAKLPAGLKQFSLDLGGLLF